MKTDGKFEFLVYIRIDNVSLFRDVRYWFDNLQNYWIKINTSIDSKDINLTTRMRTMTWTVVARILYHGVLK